MKYLHIMGGGNVGATRTFFNMICESFDSSEHFFLLIGANLGETQAFKGKIFTLEKYDNSQIMELIKDSDRVFLHSLFLSTDTKLKLLLNPALMRKIVWVAWGMDLYEKRYKSGLANEFKKIIDDKFKKKVKYFIGIFPPDIDMFKRKYGNRATTFFAKYVGKVNAVYNSPPVVTKIQDKVKRNEPVNVVIGHQANPVLQHKTVIDWLSRFVKENRNIHIYVPLSYGDANHIKAVEEYAKNVLSDYVTVVKDYMDLPKYMEFLQNMDIAVFHTERQIGLGNVNSLLYMQKKVYTKSSGVMYKYFKENGINVQKSEELETIPFSEFVQDVDMTNATDFINSIRDYEANVQRWRDVFTGIFPAENNVKN